MLYEKKIEEAARVYILSKKVNETAYLLLRSIDDFKAGAHLAIQEFLKSLWHDASEEPRKEATILIETKRNFYYVWKEWQNNFYPFWDDAVACSNITRWLYIDDLLEQKGEEK